MYALKFRGCAAGEYRVDVSMTDGVPLLKTTATA